jgi:hypothetical protein
MESDTAALKRILPHLRPSWLRKLNRRVEWLKKEMGGSGQVTIDYGGGVDRKTRWLFTEPQE